MDAFKGREKGGHEDCERQLVGQKIVANETKSNCFGGKNE